MSMETAELIGMGMIALTALGALLLVMFQEHHNQHKKHSDLPSH